MTINRHDGPANGIQVLNAAVAQRAHVAHLQHLLGRTPQVASPIPVYRLTRDRALQPGPLTMAEPMNWFYPIIGSEILGAYIHERSGNCEFDGLIYGTLPRRIIEACSFADELCGKSIEQFEPRMLIVHAMHLVALWLHGTTEVGVPLMGGTPPGTPKLKMVENLEEFLRRGVMGHPRHATRNGASPTN